MNKGLIIVILFFSLLSFNSFSQHNNSVSFELVTAKLNFKPGQTGTLIFKAKNLTNDSLFVESKIKLPERWRIISQVKPFSLSPGKQKILLLSFNVPSKYLAGDYSISYELIENGNANSIYAQLTKDVSVTEVVKIALEQLEAPDFVKAGETINASFILRNLGNTTQKVTIIPSNCELKTKENVEIAPGASSIINVETVTKKELLSANRKSIYITAKTATNVEEMLYCFVRVIPVLQTERDLYFRFPINFSSRFISKTNNGETQSGYQFEFSGAGDLDPEGKHHLEFSARGPNQFDVSLLGLNDQYSIAYKNNFMNIAVGDNSFSLTPLTESARYGFGIRNELNIIKNTTLGMFYMKPKYFSDVKSEYALYSLFNLKKNNTVGVYALNKVLNTPNNNESLFSITTELHPLEKTTIEAELSHGKGASGNDNAFRIMVNSQIKKLQLSSFFFKTGKDYPGYYSNSSFYSGFANYNLTKWLTIGISAREDYSNAKLDTLFATAPYSKQMMGLANFKLGKNMFFKGAVRKYERMDRMPVKKFHYESLSLNSNFSHKMKKVGYQVSGEYGLTQNFLLPKETSKKYTFRSSASIMYTPIKNNTIRATASYSSMNSFISDKQNNWIFGLSASSRISKSLKANLQIQSNYNIEDYYKNRNLLQFNLDYKFLKRHTVSANSFYTLFQNETEKPDYTFAISYSVNFGIPMKKIGEAGSLSGHVENLGVKSIEGLIIYMNGRSSITDENGDFSFKNIIPGSYTVFIDRTTTSMTDISSIPTPIDVEIRGNEETKLNFGLTSAVKLSGKIALKKTASISKLLDEGEVSVAHIVIELRNETESMRIITKPDGSFVFPLLRPGKWFFKIYTNSIDKQYVLDNDHFDLDLSPGETKILEINMSKKKRKIIFMNKNVNLSSDGKKK